MIFHFLFFCLILIISSKYIIRDLPYNIYYVEDMNQYENKYIPEGNMYYIRFPYNINNNIKFSLTLPKNITLFPVYIAEFSQYPSDKEILNTNFKQELELKNRDDFHYSVYSFDIKNNEPYKVLYFKNNEILNYISFYGSSISDSSNNDTKIIINNLVFNSDFILKNVSENNSYFFRVKIEGNEKEILVKTIVLSSLGPIYSLDITHFNYEVSDEELTNLNNYKTRPFPYNSRNEYRDEIRTYTYKSENNIKVLGIHLYSNKFLESINITAFVDKSFPGWAIALIVIGGAIVLSFISLLIRKYCCS